MRLKISITNQLKATVANHLQFLDDSNQIIKERMALDKDRSEVLGKSTRVAKLTQAETK